MGFVKHRKHTNKDFKDNFVNLASTNTKKGHLTKQERGADDNQTIVGVLKHVIKDRIDSDGWMVEIGSGNDVSVYACFNTEPFLTLPDSTESETMYVPKKKTRVEISIDKQTGVYYIIRVVGVQKALSNYQNTLKISINQDTNTNQDVNAEITMTNDNIELGAKDIIINNDGSKTSLLQTQKTQANQIKVLIDENIFLKEKITNIENQLNQNTTGEGEESNV